jgi:serine-type D-Ala-D-Ala carboxypeptidase (penicillin-binding protein 5/6)
MKTYTVRGGEARGKRWWYLVVVIVLIGGYVYWTLGRALPSLTPTTTIPLQAKAPPGQLGWPVQGQAAVGLVGSPILETHGKQKPVPIASTAKLITALTVLQKKPLAAGDQGPLLTMTDQDVTLYRNYAAQDGSLVKVVTGEKISQYQVLQAIMLPSSNNLSDSLAIWAFGSLKAYTQAANQYLEKQGLHDTHVGNDASGMSPTTTSTAPDLVEIGKLTMQNPVLAEIVGQSTASGIPVVNNIKNVNSLLGSNGIIGIKTGNTEQAGGVFVSASRTTVNSKPVTIVTALAGSPSLFQAMKDSLPLIQSAQSNFKLVNLVKKDAVVGYYNVPGGGRIAAIANDTLTTDIWADTTVTARTQLKTIPAHAKAGQTVGHVVLPKSALTDQQSVTVKLQSTPSQPSAWWRLTHPL